MADIARLVRTVAYLEPAQLWHRARLTARRVLWTRRGRRVADRYRARAEQLPLVPFDDPGLARVAALRCARRDAKASRRIADDALEGRFTFLAVTRELGRDVAWHREDLDAGTRLWKTLLHEFPYAIELARAARESGDRAYRERLMELVASWQEASPIGRRGFACDAWNARAVATRLVNLALAGSLLGLRATELESERLARAIALHALFLRENLELDLRGNHLLRDAHGLVFAHALLGCAPEAEEFLHRELDRQVLPDGCHVERVPLYHAIVLEDLIECRALLGDRSPGWLDHTVARMAGFLDYLLPADGRLPLFGDTWRGEIDLRRLLEEAGPRRIAPPAGAPERHSGLVVLRRGDAHCIARCGLHGPDHQLGHAHADGLSFELSLGDAPIVTDTGTGTYDAGPARDRMRSTGAHNTVALDGHEQIEAWGSFRVGRRGRGRVVARGGDARWDWVWAVHDGWRWLAGSPLHHRLLALCDRALLVLDAVGGRGRHSLRSTLHLHPDHPSQRVAVAALLGTAVCSETSLHESLNCARPMTELAVEDRAALPWVGGWLVRLDAGSAPDALSLSHDGHRIAARARSDRWEIAARWCVAPDAAHGAVELELTEAPGLAGSTG